MESKTKHRILGILVVAGLIVLMLPFFQSNREFSGNVGAVNAPPFPEQSSAATAKLEQQAAANQTVAATQTQSAPATTTTVAQPAVDNKLNQLPDEAISQSHTETPNVKAPEINNPLTQPQSNTGSKTDAQQKSPQETAEAQQPTKSHELALNEMDDEVAPLNATMKQQQETKLVNSALKSISQEEPTSSAKPATLKVNKHATLRSAQRKSLRHAPIENDGLFKLKNAAYVVQLGSYSNRAQAIRVVNQLRAKGYRAFIQQFSSTKGHTTSVFVGPENKQATARVLASELESEVHMRGMVISYKPLSL